MTHLSVNVDHVATLRQARGVDYPDPAEAAALAEAAGAGGITVHLRSDRRHIQDSDLDRLSTRVQGKLNLEIAATDEMLDLARLMQPDQVTLVPERPDEITTEGGLDLRARGPAVAKAAELLASSGIEVSLFLDPDLTQLDALNGLSVAASAGGPVSGFEINTDSYTRATLGDAGGTADALRAVSQAATAGRDLGFRVYAGHGLTTANVGPVAALEPVEELNIGHSIISRAVLVGMTEAVSEMLAAMAAAAETA